MRTVSPRCNLASAPTGAHLFAMKNELGTGKLPHPPSGVRGVAGGVLDTRPTCYAEQRLLPICCQIFKSEAVRAMLTLRLQMCVHKHANPLCAGSFGRGVRPLFQVKQNLMRHNIPLPRCSKWHRPEPHRSVDSAKIVNPQLAPTASTCGMCTGARGTNAAGYAP